MCLAPCAGKEELAAARLPNQVEESGHCIVCEHLEALERSMLRCFLSLTRLKMLCITLFFLDPTYSVCCVNGTDVSCSRKFVRQSGWSLIKLLKHETMGWNVISPIRQDNELSRDEPS